jgi:hypothetical protein
MTWKDTLQIIIGLIGGGGLLSGIYAILKLRPEAGQIVVTAAQGALVVQAGVIDDLNDEIKRLKQVNQDLRLEVDMIREELVLIKTNQGKHDIEIASKLT